jgi:hypothetical protein
MKKNYGIMILIMSFALIVPTIAEQENIVLGPYRVSFDMGIDNLKWNISKPTISETLSGSAYTSYDAFSSQSSLVSIIICEYNFTTQDVSGDIRDWGEMVGFFFRNLGCTDVVVRERTIDGHSAAIGTGKYANADRTLYNAYWWMDNTSVNVVSDYPWDEGTLALVNTIHIEKMNATT